MSFRDAAKTVLRSIAPALASAFGGPLAGLAVKEIGDKLLGKPDATEYEVVAAVAKASPDQLVKLREIDAAFKVRITELGNEASRIAAELDGKALSEVNATMRAEAAAEHWPTYSWRPAIGFAVAIVLLLCGLTTLAAYAGAMWFGKTDALQHLPGMLGAMSALLGVVAAPILGVASYFRGRMQADPNIPTVNRG